MVGDRIHDLRERRGLQQQDLASKATIYAGRRIDPATMSRIEHNKQRPTTWMIEAFANALDTSVDYLMGRTEDYSAPGKSEAPIPAMELVPLVEYLNTLPAPARERAVRAILEMFRLGQLAENALTTQTAAEPPIEAEPSPYNLDASQASDLSNWRGYTSGVAPDEARRLDEQVREVFEKNRSR